VDLVKDAVNEVDAKQSATAQLVQALTQQMQMLTQQMQMLRADNQALRAQVNELERQPRNTGGGGGPRPATLTELMRNGAPRRARRDQGRQPWLW
jgi:cell division protein FtsB